MAEIKMIPLAAIAPPLRPMRQDTLAEGLEELKADLDKNGQMQPIGVVQLSPESYRLVWGSRRCAAAEEMGWTEIQAQVYPLGQIDESDRMAAENFQRTQLNPVEEAHFYREFIDEKHISVAEAARRTHRSLTTVKNLLSLLDGDEEVLSALRAGEINKGQAEQLNLVRDEIGRKQGLGWAKAGLMTARELAGWRENREVTGISDSIEQVKINLDGMPMIDYRTMAKCVLHNDYVELMSAPPRCICDGCWDLIVTALNYYHQMHQSPNTTNQAEEE